MSASSKLQQTQGCCLFQRSSLYSFPLMCAFPCCYSQPADNGDKNFVGNFAPLAQTSSVLLRGCRFLGDMKGTVCHFILSEAGEVSLEIP